MKRVLLIGIVLAIFILAMPQGVSADPAAQPIAITALYGSATEFTVDAGSGGTTFNFGTLTPSDDNRYNAVLNFYVKSQSIWTVTGKDVSNYPADPLHRGYMEGSQGPLNHAFQMTTKEDANWHDFTGTSLTVNHGIQSAAPVPWTADVMQRVDDNDNGSSSGYQMNLQFDCQASF